MNKNTIIIAEDHPLVCLGLKRLINSISPQYDFIETDTCESFLKIMRDSNASFCIVDLNLIDGLAFDSITNVLKLYPETCVLVYTSFPGEIYAKRLFEIGIHGFLNKKATEIEIVECLTKFLQNEFYVSPEFLPLIFNSINKSKKFVLNPFDILSMQEMTIVEHLLKGEGTKTISEKMGILPNTTATYKKRAFNKLGVENILQLDMLYKSFNKSPVH